MSDPQTVFRLGVAFFCAAGAAWMKFGSGVSDDGKTDGVHGVWNERASGNRGADSLLVGRCSMKDQDEHRGQVIDFETARNRRALREWGRCNGFPPKRDQVT